LSNILKTTNMAYLWSKGFCVEKLWLAILILTVY
jgi:hypothetical protein